MNPAPDVFVLRRVAAGRFVHLGGEGRGEGWAGIVESSLDEDAAVAEALRTVRPVRIDRTAAERIFGPYYARSAAIVPVSQDAVVVFGSRDGPIAADDAALVSAATDANDALEPAGKAKQLADELELLEAVRAAVAVPPDPVDKAMEALAGVAAEMLSCELAVMYVADGSRLAVAERGWPLKIPANEVIVSLRNVLEGSALPVLRAGCANRAAAGCARPRRRHSLVLPARADRPRTRRAARRTHRSRLAAWRFTQCSAAVWACAVAEAASAVLGVGLTREWTAAESAARLAVRVRSARTATGAVEQGHDVEPDVTRCDARGRIAVGDSQARQRACPAPGADRRSVELECGDDEEHARVERPVSRAPRKTSRRGTPTAPATSRRGSTVRPSSPHVAAAAAAIATSGADVPAQRGREREPGEVDDAVSRRYEERQVVQAVVVDAPDERARALRRSSRSRRLRVPARDARGLRARGR